jgi:hypothetical protein
MTDRKTRERPLGLDMDPDEALERFIGVDPAELPDSIKLRRKKEGPPKRPPSPKGVDAKPSRPKGKATPG